LTGFEEDVESLLPLETEASTSSRDTNSRDALLREDLSLQRLSASSQKDRYPPIDPQYLQPGGRGVLHLALPSTAPWSASACVLRNFPRALQIVTLYP
jgi:hypothetical protein